MDDMVIDYYFYIRNRYKHDKQDKRQIENKQQQQERNNTMWACVHVLVQLRVVTGKNVSNTSIKIIMMVISLTTMATILTAKTNNSSCYLVL